MIIMKHPKLLYTKAYRLPATICVSRCFRMAFCGSVSRNEQYTDALQGRQTLLSLRYCHSESRRQEATLSPSHRQKQAFHCGTKHLCVNRTLPRSSSLGNSATGYTQGTEGPRPSCARHRPPPATQSMPFCCNFFPSTEHEHYN